MASAKRIQSVTLKTATGEELECHVAGSEKAAQGIIIFHEWWGLKPHNLDWVQHFAKLGYRSMVVDLYAGRVTDNTEQAGNWMRDLDHKGSDAKLLAALDYLSNSERKIATFGASMGGRYALRLALLRPEAVAAVVAIYSRMETDIAKLKPLRAPVLGIYAEQERNWPDKQQDFEAAADAIDKEAESVSYDAAHGFVDPDSEHYDEIAGAEAWDEVVKFLARRMK